MAQSIRQPIDIPPGLVSDDTTFAAAPAWADGCNIRFRLKRPQTMKGWESLTLSLLTGVCRGVLAWTDNAGTLNIGFGTHTNLQVWVGGQLYDVTPTGLAAGQTDGTGQAGYSTGAYGVGGYGLPSTTDYFPRTWSLAAWGQKLVASPRGGTLYEWSNDPSAKALAVANAPAQITAMLVSPQRQVFALGCSQEVGGVFNPLCLRHSGIGDETSWSTDATSSSTAREYVLPGGGRIVAGKFVGRYLLIWTSHSLFLGTYVGQVAQVWSFNKVADRCGLVGPNAVAVLGSTAYWLSPDLQFLSYALGQSVAPIACPIRDDFADNLTPSQADKIVCSTLAEYSEVRWDYPDQRDGLENSRYLGLAVDGPDAGSWFRGETLQGVNPARTAMTDAGPAPYPIGCTADGHAYWEEKGWSADAAPLPWFVETADIYLDPAVETMATQVWPDISEQRGPVQMTFTTRPRPQAPETQVASVTVAPGESVFAIRGKGRLWRLKYSGYSAPSSARIGRIVVLVTPCGRRG